MIHCMFPAKKIFEKTKPHSNTGKDFKNIACKLHATLLPLKTPLYTM